MFFFFIVLLVQSVVASLQHKNFIYIFFEVVGFLKFCMTGPEELSNLRFLQDFTIKIKILAGFRDFTPEKFILEASFSAS